MKEPLVSIMMITYNQASFIVQAIEGGLNQKVSFPFEFVIGEDCSTDGTREIVLDYQRKHPGIVRVITSEKNVGAKQNYLRSLKACAGKYIAFCEGDDYWHDLGKLQKQADYLENHPECGLVYSSYDVYHITSGKKISDFVGFRKLNVPDNPSVSDIVGGDHKILTCTVMVRRDLCDEIVNADPFLHQTSHFPMADTQLWAEMATKARLFYFPESMATHNITDESATRSKDVRKGIRFSISNYELLLYLCDKYNLSQSIRDRYQAGYDEDSLRLAFHTRDKVLADAVRKRTKGFAGKGWLLHYYGAKSPTLYHIFRLVASLRGLFRKEHPQWM